MNDRVLLDLKTSNSNPKSVQLSNLCNIPYVGLIKDEKWYNFFGCRSSFLATLIFDILTLGGSLARTGYAIFIVYFYLTSRTKGNSIKKNKGLGLL